MLIAIPLHLALYALQALPPLPAAPASPLDTIGQVTTLVTGHQWVPLGVLLVGWAVELLRSDSKFPLSIPASWNADRWKPVAVVVLSAVYYGVVWAADKQMTIGQAAVDAARTAFFTLGLYAVVVKAVFKGNPPSWVRMLALVFPPPPAQKSPPTSTSK